MLPRFSSRESARNEARKKRRASRLAYSPMQGKQVFVLPNFDVEAGLRAGEVAQ